MNQEQQDETYKIRIIVSQTCYSETDAQELLESNNGDYIKIIKEYLKTDTKPNDNAIAIKPSINQEIYKQIRAKMNENMDVVIERMNGSNNY
jgi:hypothetical protein